MGRHANRSRVEVEALVLRHRPLARHLARRYARGDRELMEELEQVAALGLVKAARRFEPERGSAFSSYAVPTIVGELRRYFRSTRWSLHVPRRLQEAFLTVRRTEAEMTAQDGRSPSAADIAERLGWSGEDVLDARSAAGALALVSLDAADDDEDGSPSPLSERVGAEDTGYDDVELRDELELARSYLDRNADEAVRLRFEQELTFEEIAERIGVSPSHAANLVRRALAVLGHTLGAHPVS